jgi:hypothetical protein
VHDHLGEQRGRFLGEVSPDGCVPAHLLLARRLVEHRVAERLPRIEAVILTQQ